MNAGEMDLLGDKEPFGDDVEVGDRREMFIRGDLEFLSRNIGDLGDGDRFIGGEPEKLLADRLGEKPGDCDLEFEETTPAIFDLIF